MKLESTCKIALRFLICLGFDDFSKVVGRPLKVGKGCVGMLRSRFGGWNSFCTSLEKSDQNQGI